MSDQPDLTEAIEAAAIALRPGTFENRHATMAQASVRDEVRTVAEIIAPAVAAQVREQIAIRIEHESADVLLDSDDLDAVRMLVSGLERAARIARGDQ